VDSTDNYTLELGYPELLAHVNGYEGDRKRGWKWIGLLAVTPEVAGNMAGRLFRDCPHVKSVTVERAPFGATVSGICSEMSDKQWYAHRIGDED
jgi:hypothetical protein